MTAWLSLLLWAVAASVLHLRDRRRLVRAARAGHEARGPLCTAQLALDGLERSARVEAIALELRRAALALDDLSGRPRETVTTVDLARLLSEAAPAWRALAEAHGVALVVEAGRGRVVGDRLRLAQACANLVANAIEHGAAPERDGAAETPRGLVRVSCSTADGRVRIEVRDSGPGLPAPVSELVAAARGRRSARGHGLAIAAAIAARHGGCLVTRTAERGAHVVLDLPAAR